MATQHTPETPEAQIDVTAGEWLMIIVTGFTALFLGPVALIPGAATMAMFTYRINPELMPNSKAGQWVRGLLPAPITDEDTQAPPTTATAPTGVTSKAVAATTGTVATGKAATPAKSLAMIDLAALARCSTILLVGSRGSGKSTLLRAILAAKQEVIAVYDPHAHPQAWPMATMLHNSEETISSGLASAYKRLRARRHEMRTGVRTEGWPKFTLAADEWGSIVANVKLPKEIDRTPGEVSTELMKEGRKFGIGFVAGAHGKTNKSLGCEGDQEAFLESFDWIVHMGGFTRKMLIKEYSELLDQIPMGTNEQGGTFPLIVVCESTMGELRLLDMRGLDRMVDSTSRQITPIVPWSKAKTSGDDGLLAGLLAPSTGDTNAPRESPRDMQGTAAESEGTLGDMGTGDTPTPQEIAQITMSLSRGMTVNQAAKAMKGYNGRTRARLMAKVEYVKSLMETQPSSSEGPAPDSTDDEPPEWFGKAFDQ